MPITYNPSTPDSPEYKTTICGRSEEISEVLEYISRKRSIALFGERRIGKTSVLYLVRDIISGRIQSYQAKLIDSHFKNKIDTLRAKVSNCRVIYVDLHHLDEQNSAGLAREICIRGQEAGLLVSSLGGSTQQKQTLPEVLTALANACGQVGHLVVLIDEMEVLLEFSEKKQVLRNLRGAIQSNPCINFVLSGAESWYNAYEDKSSMLSSVLDKVGLKAPSHYSIETYLIAEPLLNYLSVAESREITPCVIEWTAYKPYYVQTICEIIVKTYQTHGYLPNNWKTTIQEKVYKLREETLRASYVGVNIDELSQKILILLANLPGLTLPSIARILGSPEKIALSKISTLIYFDKIKVDNGKYNIAGALIEQWGKKNLVLPTRNHPWSRPARWIAFGLIVLLAICMSVYIYPEQQSTSFSTQQETVSVDFPISVEQDESGSMTILVHNNTSSASIKGLHVTLNSSLDKIYYAQQGSNRLSFDSIAPSEQKSLTLSYGVRASGMQILTTQVIVTQDGKNLYSTHSFSLQERIFPFRKYLGEVGALFAIIITFIAKPNLLQLISSLLSQFLQGSNVKNS